MVSTQKTSFVVALSTLFLVVSRTHAAFLRSRAYTRSTQCVIKVLDKLQDSTSVPVNEQGDDVDFECLMDPMDMDGVSGMTLPIQATEEQKNALKQMLEENTLIPGRSVLRHGHILFSNRGIFLPDDFDIQENVITEVRADGRMLEAHVTATGDKKILVVKVTDKNGKVVPDSLQTIADNVFGTSGDSNTLKSVLEGCSMGKMTVTPGLVPPGTISQPYAGVIEVTVDLDVQETHFRDFKNAITAEVNKLLKISLPGPYDHVMYSIAREGPQGRPIDCNCTAYSYFNDWNSGYYNQFYSMPAVQAHEVAHNFNLHHSRGLDGLDRSDKSGIMGNPLFLDDDSKICFNAAKNWQLSSNGNNWYSDRKLLIDPQSLSDWNDFSRTFNMVGVADYQNSPEDHYVVVKLETNTNVDFFIGLNTAKGVNENTVQARNLVTVLQAGGNGESFEKSDMKAHLFQGESYIIDNFGSRGKPLEIIVRRIDLRTSPQVAEIEIRYGNNAPPSQPLECNNVLLSIKTDNYPGETSWKLFNNGYGMEMITGGGYTAANTVYNQTLCLEDGDYEFIIEDTYGDGMCCGYGNGYWKLMFDGSTLLEGAEFGSSLADTFNVTSGSSSESPSSPPSLLSTLNPSAIPTFSSSDGPSIMPSFSPTAFPSSGPSESPSMSSNKPSNSPSSLPSSEHSELPSLVPSDTPSLKESDTPSLIPSTIPSNEHSELPSWTPSSSPSLETSLLPSSVPSVSFSDEPTIRPSTVPSIAVSYLPSKPQTDLPSLEPSVSIQPSSETSWNPTFSLEPSIASSEFPSSLPSSTPSMVSSNAPSSLPSTVPSIRPSEKISDAPSDVPISEPSLGPSSLFSSNPSLLPSLESSEQPSDRSESPSLGPSSLPSDLSSEKPSLSLSAQPSNTLSNRPSITPSNPPSISFSNPPSEKQACDLVRVEIVTDNYPAETSWQLTDATTNTILSGGNYQDSGTTYSDEICVDDWTILSFTINDSYGDGICCSYGSGSYTVTVNDNVVLTGGDFAFTETKPLYCLYGEEIINGELVCRCAPDEVRFSINLVTDKYPQETKWTISTCAGDEILQGSYANRETEYNNSYCIAGNQAYTFEITDTYGDGICCSYGQGNYRVSIDGKNVISSDGAFGSSEEKDVNGECSNVVAAMDRQEPLFSFKCSSVMKKQDCEGNCEWVGGNCTLKQKEEPASKCEVCRSTGVACCGSCVNNGPQWMRGCY